MPSSINDLLSSEEISSIRLPIESALTLPASAFTDDRFYQLEIENIYKKHWIAAQFESEIGSPGDIKPFDVCDIPLLAVRGQDGKLRVFHNICPYDGCLAAIDPAQGLQEIVTPYHGWTYDLEGKLIKTPYWDGSEEGNLDALAGKQVDLIPVNCETFLNTLFINLSDQPEPFAQYIAPLFRAMDEYDLAGSKPGLDKNGNVYTSIACVNTNWKTFFENACINVLHENFVHAVYNASPEVPRIKSDGISSFNNIIDEKFMALGYNRLDFQNTYPPVEAPHMGKDPAKEPEGETFGTLYPNFYISASSQFIETAIVLPKGPGVAESNVCYHFQADVAVAEEAVEERRGVADGFYGAFMEDARIAEAVQKARKSPVYSQHFYAPFWDAMHHYFSNMILDDLEGG